MTRLTGPLKFDWTNLNSYPDESPSDAYAPGNPNAVESDPNIPFLSDGVPTKEELMAPDRPVAPSKPEWGPKDPIRYVITWPPKVPIEAPPPDRPPMWLFGPTPSQIARAALPNGIGGAAGGGLPPDSQRLAPQPRPMVQNLTTQVLRSKGVPEADIGAAISAPVTMQALLSQLYGRRSVITPRDDPGRFGNPFGRAIPVDQPDQASTPVAAAPDNYLPFGWAGLQALLR